MGNCCGGEEDNKDMTIDPKGNKGGSKGASVGQGAYAMEDDSNTDITTYCNSKVRSILNDLDDFEIPSVKDGTRVEERPMRQLDNDARYKGEWSPDNEMRHGRGTQVWHDGSIYQGQWRNDKANGRGRLIHADGDVYEGEWLDDKAHGQGVYTHTDGAKYVGEWKEDKQDGHGVETWPDGAKYTGTYVDGKKHGKGEFVWADGS